MIISERMWSGSKDGHVIDSGYVASDVKRDGNVMAPLLYGDGEKDLLLRAVSIRTDQM